MISVRFRLISRLECNKLNGEIQLMCRLGCNTKENQNHLLNCEALSDSSIVEKLPEYADLHGKDVEKLEIISKILQARLKLLKELHELDQVNGSVQPPTGAVQSCSASNINIYVPNVNISFDDLD